MYIKTLYSVDININVTQVQTNKLTFHGYRRILVQIKLLMTYR